MRNIAYVIGLASLTVSACSKPPSDLVNQARQAEEVAVADGAQEYAPEALGEAAAARAALEAELAVQSERWGPRRSYGQAESLAETYRLASERAAAEATAARDAAYSVAEALIAESEDLLEQVRGMLVVAPVGKGSAADLAAMRGDLDAAEAGLESARASLLAQEYLEAQASATAARDIIDGVHAALEQARAARAG